MWLDTLILPSAAACAPPSVASGYFGIHTDLGASDLSRSMTLTLSASEQAEPNSVPPFPRLRPGGRCRAARRRAFKWTYHSSRRHHRVVRRHLSSAETNKKVGLLLLRNTDGEISGRGIRSAAGLAHCRFRGGPAVSLRAAHRRPLRSDRRLQECRLRYPRRARLSGDLRTAAIHLRSKVSSRRSPRLPPVGSAARMVSLLRPVRNRQALGKVLRKQFRVA
jgi:hypothetical protein